MATTRTTFPATITASTWASAWGAAFERSTAKYGRQVADDGTIAPVLTCADLAALTRAWRIAAGAAAFPLWSQWGALAYDWDAARPSRFDTSAKRAGERVPADVVVDFWRGTRLVALGLDDVASNAKLDVDAGTFGDPVWLAMVKSDLLSDGAQIEWKIPVGCRDPKTGKAKPPHMGCKPGWKLVQVSPGAFMCEHEATGERRAPERICEGDEVAVRDPITAAKDSLFKLLLILGAAWYLTRQGNRGNR